MYYRKNGHLFGVLIDFDLASLAGEPSHNWRRTGTRPFMACGSLLGGGTFHHLYKHDAESFFWVVVYDSASQSTQVYQWGDLDDTTLGAGKSHYLLRGSRVIWMDHEWENPQPIQHWLDKMRHFLMTDELDKDWDVDALYNILRSSLEDGGAALSGHIKARQAKYVAESAQ